MGTAKHPAPKRNLAGFSLPLLAALLIVASLAATTILLEHNREAVWKPQADTKSQLKSVTDSLVKFQRAYHRLPCPAPYNQLPSSINFGAEGANCSLGGTISGIERHDIGGGKFMRVGVLPVRTLGLTEAYNADEWGNRLTYAVIESQTDPFQFSSVDGTLKMTTDNGTTVTDGAYAIIAHGKDGKGAYSLKAGTVGVSCTDNSTGSGGDKQILTTQSTRDNRNCNYGANQGEFLAYSSNLQKGTNYFDDQVVVAAADTAAKGVNLPCVAPSTPTPVTWTDASDPLANCSAPFTNMVNGETRTLTNTSSSNSGNANVRCNNGVVEIVSSSCAHTVACPSGTASWSGTGNGCSAPRGDLEEGQSVTLTNTATGRSGSTTVTCNSGVVTPSASSCTGNSCTLNGTTIVHNGTISAFATSSVACGTVCASETRTCSYGTLSGSYENTSCSASACSNCTFDGVTVPHNSSAPAFASSSVACGSSCQSETRTCTNGVLSGTYASSSCSVQACASCTLDGINVPHGGSIAAFENSSVPCGTICQSQNRSCDNGVLSGTYSHSGCTAASCGASCAAQNLSSGDEWYNWYVRKTGNNYTGECQLWHASLPAASNGAQVTWTADDCGTGTLTWQCNSGTWQVTAATCSNNYCTGGITKTNPTCNHTECFWDGTWDGTSASCTTPWGGTVVHGASVTAYSASSVACGSSCASETRTCTNGTLSGSYTNQSCSVASCGGVWERTQIVNYGSLGNGLPAPASTCTLSAINTNTDVNGWPTGGGACSSIGSTCLYRLAQSPQLVRVGTFECKTATSSGNASCTAPWNATVLHGASVTAYSASSVACGSTCQSQARTCTNGVLSGSYTNQNCSVAACGGHWVYEGNSWSLGNCGAGTVCPSDMSAACNPATDTYQCSSADWNGGPCWIDGASMQYNYYRCVAD